MYGHGGTVAESATVSFSDAERSLHHQGFRRSFDDIRLRLLRRSRNAHVQALVIHHIFDVGSIQQWSISSTTLQHAEEPHASTAGRQRSLFSHFHRFLTNFDLINWNLTLTTKTRTYFDLRTTILTLEPKFWPYKLKFDLINWNLTLNNENLDIFTLEPKFWP